MAAAPPSLTVARRLWSASRRARQEIEAAGLTEARPDIEHLTAEFLAAARHWFAALPDGRWSIQAAKDAGLLPQLRAATDAYVQALAVRFRDATAQARRRAYVGAFRAHSAALEAFGQERATTALKGPKGTIRATLAQEVDVVALDGHLIEVLREADSAPFTEPPEPAPDTRRRVARAIVREADGRVWTVTEEADFRRQEHAKWPDVAAEHPQGVGDMFPGGGLEPEESFQEAAVRECLEETGLCCELSAWLCDLHDRYSQRRYYLAHRRGGIPTTRDEDGNRPVQVQCVTPEEATKRLSSPFDRAAQALVVSGSFSEVKGPGDEAGHWVTINGRPVFIRDQPAVPAPASDPLPNGFTNPLDGGPGPSLLYHGARSNAPSAFGPGLVYLTDNPVEAKGYALGGHVPGQVGTGRVLVVRRRPGPTQNVVAQVDQALMNGQDMDQAIDELGQAARAKGYRYLYFEHPSFTQDDTQRVVISLYPHRDLTIVGGGIGSKKKREADDPDPDRPDGEQIGDRYDRERIDAILAKYVPESIRQHIGRLTYKSMGGIHGQTDDHGNIALNPSIFSSTKTYGRGDEPTVDHLTWTLVHECLHALAAATQADQAPEWLALSGWRHSPKVTPKGYARYVEKRAGWPQGPSEWIYKHGAWFLRRYSAASPAEQFADDGAALLLGWEQRFTSGGEAQRDYVRAALKGGMTEAFDPAKHPHQPGGSPVGGQWAPTGTSEIAHLRHSVADRIGPLPHGPVTLTQAKRWRNTASTAKDLRADAKKAEPLVRQLIDNAAISVEGHANYGPGGVHAVKDPGSLQGKIAGIVTETDLSVAEATQLISDAVRGTIIVDQPEQVRSAAAALQASVGASGGRIVFDNKWASYQASGYGAVHADALLPLGNARWIRVEIQIHLRAVNDGTGDSAKERAHAVRGDWKNGKISRADYVRQNQKIYAAVLRPVVSGTPPS